MLLLLSLLMGTAALAVMDFSPEPEPEPEEMDEAIAPAEQDTSLDEIDGLTVEEFLFGSDVSDDDPMHAAAQNLAETGAEGNTLDAAVAEFLAAQGVPEGALDSAIDDVLGAHGVSGDDLSSTVATAGTNSEAEIVQSVIGFFESNDIAGEDLTGAVDQFMADHGITRDEVLAAIDAYLAGDLPTSDLITATAATDVAAEEEELDGLVNGIQFDGTPPQMAEPEPAPEVEETAVTQTAATTTTTGTTSTGTTGTTSTTTTTTGTSSGGSSFTSFGGQTADTGTDTGADTPTDIMDLINGGGDGVFDLMDPNDQPTTISNADLLAGIQNGTISTDSLLGTGSSSDLLTSTVTSTTGTTTTTTSMQGTGAFANFF